MANFANPTVGSAYTSFPTEIRDAVTAALQQLSVGSHSNIPTGAIQFSLSDNRWKKYNGSAFVDLTSTYAFNAQISATQLSLGDSQKILFGASNDLEILHDGFNSVVRELGTGSLFLQSDNNVYLGNAAGSQQYIEASLAQVVIKSGNNEKIKIDSTGAILPDNSIMRFGAVGDLQIYHNGSSSYIDNTTGNLYFRGSDGQMLFRPNNNEDALVLKPNGAVELYYDNVIRLGTTSTGVSVVGTLACTSHFQVNDNVQIQLGNSGTNDFVLVHDGTDNIINCGNNGILFSRSATHKLQAINAENMLVANTDGAVELYYDNVKKFETASYGVSLTGNVLVNLSSALNTQAGSIQAAGPIIAKSYINAHTSNAAVLQYISNKAVLRAYGATSGSGILQFNVGGGGDATDFEALRITSDGHVQIPADSKKIQLGASQDLQIYHDGTSSRIHNATGNLTIKSNSILGLYTYTGTEAMAKFIANGTAELYYDNSKKFETTSIGISVTGRVAADEFHLGNTEVLRWGTSDTAYIQGQDGISGYLKFAINSVHMTINRNGTINLPDNNKITFGAGDDLQIYHNGTHSYIENATGGLYIKVGNGEFLSRNGTEVLGKFLENGAVELYHDGSKKFETTSTGATVTGNVTATSFLGDGSALTGVAPKVVSTQLTSTFTNSDNPTPREQFQTALSLSITPSSSSVKLLVMISGHINAEDGDSASERSNCIFRCFEDSTEIGVEITKTTGGDRSNIAQNILRTPNSTATKTYHLKIRSSDDDENVTMSAGATLTILEVS